MIILLDSDGVLSDFKTAYLDAVYEVGGVPIDPSRVDKWSIASTDVFRETAELLGTSVRGLRDATAAHVNRPGFCAGMKTLPGAQLACAMLRERGHELYVVTSPWDSSQTWMYERAHWLKKMFNIDRKHVIHTAAKHMVVGDMFVDDKLQNVEAWWRRWGRTAFVFDSGIPVDASGLHYGGWDKVLEIAEHE